LLEPLRSSEIWYVSARLPTVPTNRCKWSMNVFYLFGMDFVARNFWGFSYGTAIGAYLVNMFPTRVGRVLLDGNIDPVQWSSKHVSEFFKCGCPMSP
jgi:hypothetical protein